MMWMMAIADLAIFGLAIFIYKRSGGMMLVAANPFVSLGSAALLLVTGIVLWKKKKWGVFLFALVGALLILGVIQQLGWFAGNRTSSLYDIALLGAAIFFYSSLGFELWREINRSNEIGK
jgi:hypothetical protein